MTQRKYIFIGKSRMKRFILITVLLVQFCLLYCFDFNGVWSSEDISIRNWSYMDKSYSWGNVREPIDCGFSIDLGKNEIYTNDTWYFNIQIDYENNTFSFINPLSKKKETYYITIISDYEILLETDVERDSLLVAKNINEKNKKSIHYFKIDGPKKSKCLKAPVYAVVLEDSDLLVKDYKGILHNTGHVSKGQVVEVWGISSNKVIEISELEFNFAIIIGEEIGGNISPLKIEFLDDISISGYGKKKD